MDENSSILYYSLGNIHLKLYIYHFNNASRSIKKPEPHCLQLSIICCCR